MRHSGVVGSGILLCAALFSSCTCHQQVESPSTTFQEPPTGFHVSQPQITPHVLAQAPTPTTFAMPTPAEVAQAGGSPTPVAEVPADFPKDVPIYKDAAVSGVQDLANNAHNVIFKTTAPVADVFNFYQDKMTHSGWKATQQFQRPDHMFVTFQKGKMIANFTIAQDPTSPGKQIIAIMYEEQQPLDFDEF